jgi:hypothetical protein
MSGVIKYIENYIPTEKEKEYDSEICSNWVRLSEHIGQINNARTLARMIKTEMMGRKRPQIIFRLHSRLCTVRRGSEQKKLMEMITQ